MSQEWHHSGSGCCSPFGTCMLAWCCPCILYGRTKHRVKNNGQMHGYSACNGSCAAFCGLSCLGVPFILPWLNRSDMRVKYNLKGGSCSDCLCACCCSPCDLVQQEKEATYREGPAKTLNEQPKPQDGMHYQPQQQAYHP